MSHVTTDIAAAAEALRDGELVAFATETVYGLGANACDGEAVARIFEAKGRPSFNPLIVHVPDTETAMQLGRFNADATRLADVFWPGPMTIVVERADDCPVSELASAGLSSLAIRVPGRESARDLLRLAGCPVAAPSANISGQISPTRSQHVALGIGDRIWGVLEGGDCEVGLESTIVSCLGDTPVILRPGGVSRDDLAEALGKPIDVESESTDRPVAPGQLASHYAPNASVRLNARQARPGEAYLAFGKREPEAEIIRNLSPSGNLQEAAANLFAMLHMLDMLGAETIAVAPIPQDGLGVAINDRLARAAAPRDRGH